MVVRDTDRPAVTRRNAGHRNVASERDERPATGRPGDCRRCAGRRPVLSRSRPDRARLRAGAARFVIPRRSRRCATGAPPRRTALRGGLCGRARRCGRTRRGASTGRSSDPRAPRSAAATRSATMIASKSVSPTCTSLPALAFNHTSSESGRKRLQASSIARSSRSSAARASASAAGSATHTTAVVPSAGNEQDERVMSLRRRQPAAPGSAREAVPAVREAAPAASHSALQMVAPLPAAAAREAAGCGSISPGGPPCVAAAEPSRSVADDGRSWPRRQTR